MITISREHLKSDEIFRLIQSLDSSFANNLQETVDLKKYSRKLATYATFEIARIKEDIYGIVAFYTNIENQNIYIPYICVNTFKRHLGIGKALLESICEYAQSEEMSIALEVRKTNTNAIKLYKKFGFQIEGENEVKYYMKKNYEYKKYNIKNQLLD